VDVVVIMEVLAEQGITVLIETDAERMAERCKPWTFVASGAPLRADVLVRTDAASVEQCRAAFLPRLRESGFSLSEGASSWFTVCGRRGAYRPQVPPASVTRRVAVLSW
jgi:hypothetical protein